MTTKLLAATAALLTLALTISLLPVLFVGGAPPVGVPCPPSSDGASMPAILATIRQLESGGDYTITAAGSSASGAYQFLDSSWAGYRGYRRAYLAPPDVQDAKATELVTLVLDQNAGDVGAVPVAWYIGHVPPRSSPEWDTVPAPAAGNRLTPREYQQRWMAEYEARIARVPDQGSLPRISSAGTVPSAGCESVARSHTFPGGWSLPVQRDVIGARADQIDEPTTTSRPGTGAIPTRTRVNRTPLHLRVATFAGFRRAGLRRSP